MILNHLLWRCLQIEQAKKLLGDHYNSIDEIRVVTFDKKTKEVIVNQVNAFCEFIDAVNITEFDAKRLNIKRIDGLKDVYYLPFGDTSYNNNFGIKKDAALNLKNEFFD
ncbi:hypothetical protein [uncultured Campylobacter sp.]|uniref:hypothetical protein n=1 Tax=uncultured Campylobacter sp. TaxID=218934 RepID=UPI002623AFD7|nr:hypothetical protein [uncultured Campylobacter sp.]